MKAVVLSVDQQMELQHQSVLSQFVLKINNNITVYQSIHPEQNKPLSVFWYKNICYRFLVLYFNPENDQIENWEKTGQNKIQSAKHKEEERKGLRILLL